MDRSPGESAGSSSVPESPLRKPLSRKLVELLLEADGDEKGMVLVVNEAARFKAASDGETLDAITLDTVREEVLDEHVGPLERAGIVTYDEDDDHLSLADSGDAVRSRLEAARAEADRERYK